MTLRENTLKILNYEKYDSFPIIAFGYWGDTVDKWAVEGHITPDEARDYKRFGDNSPADNSIMAKLGFDFAWNPQVNPSVLMRPSIETKIISQFPDGSRIYRNSQGLIIKDKPGTVSIPAEIGTSLDSREAWEELYLPRLQKSAERVNFERLKSIEPPENRKIPHGLHLGSLIGNMRNILGVTEMSYLWADDEELFCEIADTLCGICYDCARLALETGVKFDYAHYWEDVCFKNGPLVSPGVVSRVFVPWYEKINRLCADRGIGIVSLDCDGCIDSLLPLWLGAGVNTMFPIEVGTWGASIAPWREKYGRELRGIGGMNKTCFSKDKAAVESEVERLVSLVSLGGYIPCPDHRIAPDAKFELVRYYCALLRDALK